MSAYPHAGCYPPDDWPNQHNRLTPGSSIGVYVDQACTTLATIWEDRDRLVVAANPFTLDVNGNNPLFFADPDDYWAARIHNGVPGVPVRICVDVDDEDALDEDAVNVQAYGALGIDTDDTAALTVAIARAKATSGRLYFPPGTYQAENLVAANMASLELFGDGEGVSILKLRDSDAQTVTADTGTDRLTVAAIPAGYVAPSTVRFLTTGTLPAPLVAGTYYFTRDHSGATFKVSATSGGAAIDLTTTGTGVHSVEFGLGQILNMTDVIKVFIHDIGFDGNYDNAKPSVIQFGLVKHRNTVASAGRKDCVFDVRRCYFKESAKGYGHIRCQGYENADETLSSEFARVSVRDCTFVGTGHLGSAVGVRGPAASVELDNLRVDNFGPYGIKSIGLSFDEVGSTATPFGVSCENSYGQYVRNLHVSNITLNNCHGFIYEQMVANSLIENVTSNEEGTNSYWDSAPAVITAVDVAANTITTTIPADRTGTLAAVKFTTTGTLPDGLSTGTVYFVKTPITAGTFAVATTSNGAAVDIGPGLGSGVHSVTFLGYSYHNMVKMDDCLWDNTEAPTQHVLINLCQAKSSLHTSHRAVVVESSIGGSANTEVTGRVTVRDCRFDRPSNVQDAFPGLVTVFDNCIFEGGWVPASGPAAAYGTSSPLSLLGGTVTRCTFGIIRTGSLTFTLTRDLTIQGCRFFKAPKFTFSGPANLRLLDNLFNTENAGDTVLEITPPATGNNCHVVMRGNRAPANTAFATKLRITNSGDLDYLTMVDEDNDFMIDTAAGSQILSTSLRRSARNNRNANRSRSEWRKTLAAVPNPSIVGGEDWITGSATPITNFTFGVDGTKITVAVAAGHQVNNTASIVTNNGQNIAGPVVRRFEMLGTVWYEVGSSPAVGVVATQQTDDYTLVLGDADTVVEMDKATAVVLSIPDNATVAFPLGTLIEIYQKGAGTVTVTGVGIILRAPGGTKTRTQYSTVALRKRDTDEWVLTGDTTT